MSICAPAPIEPLARQILAKLSQSCGRVMSIAALMSAVLSGCASQELSVDQNSQQELSIGEPLAQERSADNLGQLGQDEDKGAEEGGSGEIVFAGSDRALRMPQKREPITFYGEAVSLNFEEAPLAEVTHTILGDILELDYVVEQPIKGMVTVRTRSPIERDQLLPILESLLYSNGALMVRGPNNRFFITAPKQANLMSPSFNSFKDDVSGYSNVIVPLRFLSAAEMAEILKPVAPPSAFVRVDVKRNLLVLAGTQMQLEGWLDIVNTFDVDQLEGTSVGIFPISRGTVMEVYEEVQHVLSDAGGAESQGLSGMVRVLPVERLNSILVVSPRASYVEAVGKWIKRLDSVDEPASEASLHVYDVVNGDASQLATLLSTIFADQASSSSGAQKSQVAPGMSAQRSDGGGAGGGMPSAGSSRASGGTSFALGDSVRVVSDDYNNALLVYASPYEYAKIERILKKLDVIATQVLIEASIVEVTLNDDLQYGLEWTFRNGIGNNYQGEGALNISGAEALSGFSYTVTNSAGDFRAVVNALADKSLINVISTPSVLVLDNHTAAIHVGDQQPIQSRVSVTDGGVSQTSIEYKDTGVKLDVTPSVNDGGLVTLDVVQSVTDTGPIDAATGQRSFTDRMVSSRIAVRSGDSVVLGGLIVDNDAQGKTGVPLLMDIPVLGSLFSTTINQAKRTELLIFITPRVVESSDELRLLTDEMRSRMRGLKNFEDLPIQ